MRVVGMIGLMAVSLVACGGGSRSSVSAGSMPANGTFTGVWFSPQYGEMHMRQTGSAVIGEYSKDERIGKIQGSVEGDLLRFTWRETREMVRGRPTVTKGRGYFKYEVGADQKHNLLGEWGIDDDETGGGPWNAYKMKNRTPRLSSDGTADPNDSPQGPDWGEAPDSTGQPGGDTEDDGLGPDPDAI